MPLPIRIRLLRSIWTLPQNQSRILATIRVLLIDQRHDPLGWQNYENTETP